MAKNKRSRNKRQKHSAPDKIDVVRMIHLEAGRLDAPAPRIFKDKSKYSRKTKHQRRYHDDSSFFLYPAA